MELEQLADEMLLRMEAMFRNRPHKMISELSKGEIFLLGYLLSCGGAARSSALGEALGTSTARIAAAVKSMEGKSWVFRETDQADHRKTIVHLTPEGEAHALGYRDRARNELIKLLRELGAKDALEYLRITKKMNEIVTRMNTGNSDNAEN
ncbi:hypothetical protein V3851_22245 [Paenibacillus sp. M1]|uniref:HTH marR-type domain-containing protein n=1 Tax=Paenibacillus haidiansis TaxID=1574488 RepID=A0ABU7VXW4_9BACL